MLVAVAGMVLLSATAACGGQNEGTSGGEDLDVVAGFFPLAEAAARVGGDLVHVTNLTPAGVEPHDLELAPRQVDAVLDADVVLFLGEGFQPAVAKAAEGRDRGDVDVLESVDRPADGRDPHFWLDPTRLAGAVDGIAEALADADPDRRSTFEANATAYKAELAALDRELAAGLAECQRREIVTSHAAFSALADRYDLTQIPIGGLSPEAEPTANRIAELADLVDEHGITTVFAEELVSPRVAEALAREASVTVDVLNPIEGLTEDEEAAGDDYADVMRSNLAVLRKALGCT